MSYLLERLRERSTWLGLAAFATALGVHLSPELSEAIVSTGVALAALAAVLTKDAE